MAVKSQHLIERLFLEPEEYEECPLRDRKQDFPTKNAHEKKKSELIKDFIALANTAALRGEPAYLLWGIKDDPPDVIGIEEALTSWDNTDAAGDNKTIDEAENWICQWIRSYVEPLHPRFDVHYGEVNGHLVACLEITPQVSQNGRPFRVKKEFSSGQAKLRIGQAWIRAGANKFELDQELIDETDPRYRFNWRTVPYILPSTLQRYIEELNRSKFVAKWEEVRSYQESLLEDGRTLTLAVDQMLADPCARMLVIEGPAGTGKSTMIQRRVRNLCESQLVQLKGIIDRMEYALPKGHIPVILVLRDVKTTLHGKGLAQAITNEIRTRSQARKPNWDPDVTRPEQILHDEDLEWLVCLDGVDELGVDARDFVDQLKGLLAGYSRVRVIMTMRTNAVYEDWASLDGVMSVKVKLLTNEQVRNYLRSAEVQTESNQEAIGFLDANADFAELCRTPAFLARAVKELLPETTIEPADNPLEVGAILPFASTVTDEDESDVPTLTPVPYAGQDEEFDSVAGTSFRKSLHFMYRRVLLLIFPREKASRSERPHKLTGNVSVLRFGSEVEEQPASLCIDPVVLSVRKGVLLKNIYDYLWERELKKTEVDRPANSWKMDAGNLALLTDGAKPKFGQDAFEESGVGRRAQDWLLMLGVLVMPANDQYSFHSVLTKLHFGSQRTATLLETGNLEVAREILLHCQPAFRAGLLELLSDVTDADLSQLT